MPSTRPQFGGRYRGTASQRNHERERVLADGTRLAALTLVMEFVALTLMALSHVATRESGRRLRAPRHRRRAGIHPLVLMYVAVPDTADIRGLCSRRRCRSMSRNA